VFAITIKELCASACVCARAYVSSFNYAFISELRCVCVFD